MKKINVIIGLVLLPFIIHTAQAAPKKPNKCPSVAAIQARGIDLADATYDSWSAGVISAKYDTDSFFTFVIGRIVTNDADSAKKIAIESLKNLKFVKGPDALLGGKWNCEYTANGLPAAAWTPPNKGPSY